MHQKLKLSHYRHTGRRQPHEYTSYIPLAVLVVLTGLALTVFSFSQVFAAHPPPQAGSIGLTGTVPSKPPTTKAVITSPSPNSHFSVSPITIKGTCEAGNLVEVFKNNIFGGSSICDTGGTFSVLMDLLFGKNSLTAQVYDANNQAGPMSDAVAVYYDSSLPASSGFVPLNLSGSQLVLQTDTVFRGYFPGQSMNVPLTIIGGTPPYAVNVQWGDNKNSVIPRSNNLTFNAAHTFQKAGVFQVGIQASDSQHRVAFLTVAAIINGQPSVATSTTKNSSPPTNKLLVLWPLYAIIATTLASFWYGEKREKRILNAANLAHSSVIGLTAGGQAPPLPPAHP